MSQINNPDVIPFDAQEDETVSIIKTSLNKIALCPNCCNIFIGECFADYYYIWEIPAYVCMFCGHQFTTDSYLNKNIVYVDFGNGRIK